MSLNKDGGAVFLTQPDCSTQLFLLTPDQKQQVSQAQALKQSTQEPDTYHVRLFEVVSQTPGNVLQSARW